MSDSDSGAWHDLVQSQQEAIDKAREAARKDGNR